MTVLVMFRRANSRCLGNSVPKMFSMTQLYSGRWFSNSRLHMLWVMPSMASWMGWAKSYIG